MKARTRLFISIGLPVLVLIVVLAAFLWQQHLTSSNDQKSSHWNGPMTTVKLALDWTPNTNHTGIYVAQAHNWYKDQGINLQILPYSSSVTPDLMVSNGQADIGISSTEAVVADAAAGQPVVSIAAIVQHNTSELVALADANIKSPRDLDGKKYGSFGFPYETAVISQMIKHDGGKGEFESVTLDVDAMQALESHRIDFVWIFEGAEGIQADVDGVKLTKFPIVNYGIADYSTPNIIASPQAVQKKADLLQRFMNATSQGYEYARLHPQEAAQNLMDKAPTGTFPNKEYVVKSQSYLSAHYVDKGHKWGVQDAESWQKYPQFIMDADGVLDANGKPVHTLDLKTLYTNKFVE